MNPDPDSGPPLGIRAKAALKQMAATPMSSIEGNTAKRTRFSVFGVSVAKEPLALESALASAKPPAQPGSSRLTAANRVEAPRELSKDLRPNPRKPVRV